LVALDVVFPSSKVPEARIGRVDHLVTIGCPFDLVRMVQKKYFRRRYIDGPSNLQWVNIYQPIDVLGSNFRNDQQVDLKAECGVSGGANEELLVKPTTNLAWNHSQGVGIVGFLMLASLSVHARYWSANPRSESAWGLVATELFANTPVLA
jgi:hypothetical protein